MQPVSSSATGVPASSDQTLIVLGAGPKALALAAKHSVLAKQGLSVPRLIIVDRQGVASHWSGQYGFTDGKQMLGTRPEKDIGYPYVSTCWADDKLNKAVAAEMLHLSWPGYLIQAGRYPDWIDRGRTRPTHGEWFAYLQWVASQTGVDVVRAQVNSISRTPDRWRLSCHSMTTQEAITLEGDGLVVTGPGRPITLAGEPAEHPRILNGETFWLHTHDLLMRQKKGQSPMHVGVIGTGETAAAIVVALVQMLDTSSFIEVISPSGVIYTRDEGFEENRLFSDPDGRIARAQGDHQHTLSWLSMTERDRREFVRRTDRGVFSLQAMSEVNSAENVRTVMGTAKHIHTEQEQVFVDTEYDGRIERDTYDYLIVAIGFNPLWFTSLLDEQTRAYLSAATDNLERRAIERAIGEDLSVQNVTPRLHLPMVAGVAQGPGFPNLSCLGVLSDRVLSSYVKSSVKSVRT